MEATKKQCNKTADLSSDPRQWLPLRFKEIEHKVKHQNKSLKIEKSPQEYQLKREELDVQIANMCKEIESQFASALSNQQIKITPKKKGDINSEIEIMNIKFAENTNNDTTPILSSSSNSLSLNNFFAKEADKHGPYPQTKNDSSQIRHSLQNMHQAMKRHIKSDTRSKSTNIGLNSII